MTADGTVSVQVFHNVERDSQGRPVGMMDGFQPHHPVSPVAELRLPAGYGFQRVCGWVFHLFNVGDDPDFGTPDAVAIAYRERGNRSLSVGDVVRVADDWYACKGVGWAPIDPPRVVPVTDVPGTFTLLLMLPAEVWPATSEPTP